MSDPASGSRRKTIRICSFERGLGATYAGRNSYPVVALTALTNWCKERACGCKRSVTSDPIVDGNGGS